MFTSSLSPPHLLRNHLAMDCGGELRLETMRNTALRIFSGEDPRIPVIVGPCSIHSIKGALRYAELLKELQEEVQDTFYLIMRVYVEKARTTIGWKGLLYDPFLNGTSNVAKGIQISRSLLLDLLKLNIPCALEFVNPLMAPYLQDLVTWGFIGARTCNSQIHRELASSLDFPIGFKNSMDGNIESAINGVICSRVSHTFLGIDDFGNVASLYSKGNPFTHIVLRGSKLASNYDATSVERAYLLQKNLGIHSKILIDCGHGNSNKDFAKQKEVFHNVIEQIGKENSPILGLMLESFIESGNQPFTLGEDLSPSLSVTDPCLSFKETKEMILWAHNYLNVSLERLPSCNPIPLGMGS